MPNTSADQIISVPQGGGAIQGLGETFKPDLFTGTGNFSFPLSIPSGRNGFQPELNLVYNSGGGNGPFGLGWSLSVPGVWRAVDKGIPRYDEDSDIFVLSGAEKLVRIHEILPGIVRYRPRTEGIFARIDYHRDAENSFWEVRSPDGLISLYGTPARLGDDPAVIADPANASHVFAWKLTETRDPFGNLIHYDYFRDQGPDGRWDQIYLKRIAYADASEAAPNGEGFLVTIDFEYEERPDPFSTYRSGFPVRTTKRCRQIDVRSHAAVSQLNRRYQLIYVDERIAEEETDDRIQIGAVFTDTLPPDRLPANGVSLLSQIHIIGQDETEPNPEKRIQALPPLEVGYCDFHPEQSRFEPLQGLALPTQSLASPSLELIDLSGSGLPDFVEMNGAPRYWRNLGDGRFDLPRMMADAPQGVSFAEPGVQLIDADGNGRADLFVNRPDISGYFPLLPGGH